MSPPEVFRWMSEVLRLIPELFRLGPPEVLRLGPRVLRLVPEVLKAAMRPSEEVLRRSKMEEGGKNPTLKHSVPVPRYRTF